MSTQPGFVVFMNSAVITIIDLYSPFPLQRATAWTVQVVIL